jgi:hypothetical protein
VTLNSIKKEEHNITLDLSFTWYMSLQLKYPAVSLMYPFNQIREIKTISIIPSSNTGSKYI